MPRSKCLEVTSTEASAQKNVHGNNSNSEATGQMQCAEEGYVMKAPEVLLHVLSATKISFIF